LTRGYMGLVLVACAAAISGCAASPQPRQEEQAPSGSTATVSPAPPVTPAPVRELRTSPNGECVRVTDLPNSPRKLRDSKPEMPEKVRAMRTHGGVLVYEVKIDESGTVTEVRIAKPVDAVEPWPTVAAAWRAAILDWRYEPTVVGGSPVAVCMTVTVGVHVI
jgi:outer membrane biosynthesis protein TonB